MAALATYPTAGGAQAEVTVSVNAFNQTVYVFTCDGCDGQRGFKTDQDAYTYAAEHAGRCTDRNASGGAS